MNEALIRVAVFAFVVGILSVWEWRRPRRVPFRLWSMRRLVNALFLAVNTVMVRIVLISSLVGVALMAEHAGLGILRAVALPGALAFALALLALDLAVYLQHRMFHAVPWLWRMHAVHHSDVEFDVSTGVRFHPLEIAVSTLIKGVAVLIIGATPAATLAFEALLSSASLFTHTNAKMSGALDAAVRSVLVTPDMHRVHHSVDADEHNRNFGFCLSWWDRLFATYRRQPRAPHERMRIGLAAFRDPSDQAIGRLMTQPLRMTV